MTADIAIAGKEGDVPGMAAASSSIESHRLP